MKNKEASLNDLEQIRAELTEKKATAEAEIKSFEEQLQQEKDKAEKAGGQIDKAINAADQPAYRKHIDEKKNAEEAQELLTKKIQQLKAAPVIDEKTYNSYADRIDAAIDGFITEQQQEYARTLEKLLAQRDAIAQAIAKANELHHLAQIELLKEAPGVYVTNRSNQQVFVKMPHRERKYFKTDLPRALQQIIDITYNYNMLLATHTDAEIKNETPRPNWNKKVYEDASLKAASGQL